MDSQQIISFIILAATIGIIVWGKIDRSVVAIFGAICMIMTGCLTEVEAFHSVDWNVITLMVSFWILAGYFGKSGIPEVLATRAVSASGGDISKFIVIIGALSGVLSLFVDNILVILIMAPVALHITKMLKINPVPFLVFIGLCANFTGSALLIGDLPPQMLHSVSGIEFLGFIWKDGRPSSFIILMITFAVVLHYFKYEFSKSFKNKVEVAKVFALIDPKEGRKIKDGRVAAIVVCSFSGTILALSLREYIGLELGIIAATGASLTVLVMETYGRKLERPSFEEVLTSLDWRSILFYVSLFVLVGGINSQGLIEMAANSLVPLFSSNTPLGVTSLYWVTVPIVGFLEHDAYILALLYMVKDFSMQSGVSPWPYWWAILWAGTLGSNLSVAGAPALLAAFNLCENEGCKVSVREFMRYSLPFVLISVLVCYALLMVFWVLS
ncbi:MAG: SLC13 family permease [Candidatus Verstraetearchaeota archaeon]|nr:SLC13 family permease [Candidatus Verstraetearchaeota archaeon]